MFFKKYILLAYFFLLVESVTSQDSLQENKQELITQFSIHLRNSYSKANSLNTLGDKNLETLGGITHSLKLGYQVNINPKFGILTRVGFGFSPMTYWDDFYEDVVWPRKMRNYFSTSIYNLYSNVELGVNYRQVLFNKMDVSFSTGFGYNFCNSFDQDVRLGQSNGDKLRFLLQYNNKAKPIVFFEVGLNKTLRNRNLLTISLLYEHFFNNIYYGNFEIREGNGNASAGYFYNSGSNLGLNVSYTFTKEKLHQTSKYNSSKNKTTVNQEKKKWKAEKRFIHPKSILIGVNYGMFFTKNKIKEEVSPFENKSFPRWSIGGVGEIGIKNDYFYEVGFNAEQYSDGVKIKEYLYSSSGTIYTAAKLYGGFGKRFIHKPSNIKLLNVHVGVSLILTDNNNKNTASSGGGSFLTEDYTLEYNYNGDYKLSLAPTIYVILEKDFQLTKNLFLSLRYRYEQGFFELFKQNYTYVENGVSGKATNVVTGTSQTYGFGFKYKILGKKWR